MWKAYTVRQGDMLSNLGFGLHRMEKDYPQLVRRNRQRKGGERGREGRWERGGKEGEKEGRHRPFSSVLFLTTKFPHW